MTYRFRVRSSERRRGLYRFGDWIASFLLCLVLSVILFFVVLHPYAISGDWFRELKRDEIVLVDRVSKYFFEFGRGDIIVYSSGDGDAFGRIIAFEGEQFTVRGGRAYIGNAYLDESAYGGAFNEQLELSLSIPEGCVLAMPDARETMDERSIEKYIIKKSGISGEVRMSIFPVKRIRIFK